LIVYHFTEEDLQEEHLNVDILSLEYHKLDRPASEARLARICEEASRMWVDSAGAAGGGDGGGGSGGGGRGGGGGGGERREAWPPFGRVHVVWPNKGPKGTEDIRMGGTVIWLGGIGGGLDLENEALNITERLAMPWIKYIFPSPPVQPVPEDLKSALL
jgi:hypothetical protein